MASSCSGLLSNVTGVIRFHGCTGLSSFLLQGFVMATRPRCLPWVLANSEARTSSFALSRSSLQVATWYGNIFSANVGYRSFSRWLTFERSSMSGSIFWQRSTMSNNSWGVVLWRPGNDFSAFLLEDFCIRLVWRLPELRNCWTTSPAPCLPGLIGVPAAIVPVGFQIRLYSSAFLFASGTNTVPGNTGSWGLLFPASAGRVLGCVLFL